MFYQDTLEPRLRFGDVLKGFISVTPLINQPPLFSEANNNFHIEVTHYDFYVVLSPCCSINDQVIALSPLKKIRNTFFDNPYFAEDLTRINRQMLPSRTVPPKVWENFTDEERQRRQLEESAFAFSELFIYEKNPLFSEYTLHKKDGSKVTTSCYMIDFRHAFRVGCTQITNNTSPTKGTKVLQLTIDTRKELREKISYYFVRPPKEDKIEV